MAQIVETNFAAEERSPVIASVTEDANGTCLWRCQVDASWSEKSDGIGMGFVLYDQEVEVLNGSRKGPQTESPLHTEAESLVWAMKEVSERSSGCLRDDRVRLSTAHKHYPAAEETLAFP